jgi:hypothetical protein
MRTRDRIVRILNASCRNRGHERSGWPGTIHTFREYEGSGGTFLLPYCINCSHMPEPVDVIVAIHHAFMNDMARIDAAALDMAKGKEGLEPTLERFRFFNEILVWHAKGEEAGVFPALEKVAPLVAEAYVTDHHGLDMAFEELKEASAEKDAIRTARATAAFRFHLKMHLAKEDAHLYRIFRERVPLAEQWDTISVLTGMVPRDRFPEVVGWWFPLVGQKDRENITRIWQMRMPSPVFAQVKELIKTSVGNDWAELTRRIPGL